MAGVLVTLEGGEGAGKTTQLRRLADHLMAVGVDVLCTREPGGAPGAEALRQFLLEQDHHLSLRAEAMVHFAARTDHIDRTIRPALEAGRFVLCDRFTDSTLAYQGYGLGLGDTALLRFIAGLGAMLELQPHLTLVLDLPAEEARRRLRARGSASDRYESLDEAFHLRVAEGFRTIVREQPQRCRLISALGSIEAVQQRLLTVLQPMLP